MRFEREFENVPERCSVLRGVGKVAESKQKNNNETFRLGFRAEAQNAQAPYFRALSTMYSLQ